MECRHNGLPAATYTKASTAKSLKVRGRAMKNEMTVKTAFKRIAHELQMASYAGSADFLTHSKLVAL